MKNLHTEFFMKVRIPFIARGSTSRYKIQHRDSTKAHTTVSAVTILRIHTSLFSLFRRQIVTFCDKHIFPCHSLTHLSDSSSETFDLWVAIGTFDIGGVS